MQQTLIKVGGSLLTMPDLIDRLSAIIDQQPCPPLLLVGGGEAADLVRHWDSTFRLGDERAHDLALQAMVLNARLLTAICPQIVLVSSHSPAIAVASEGNVPVVLHVVDIVADIEAKLPTAQHLPRSWSVTSDSIAAWIAKHIGIDHLLLLKSASVPQYCAPERTPETPDAMVRQLIAGELVDSHFSEFALAIDRLTWCNLRDEPDKFTPVW